MSKEQLYYNIDETAELLYNHIKRKNDGVIAICGNRGSGKSAFSRVLASRYANIAGIPFNLRESTYYDRKRFDNELASDSKNKIMLVDEALSILISRESMEKSQVTLVKRLGISRHRQHLTIFNTPSFYSLDKLLRSFVKIMYFIRDRPENGRTEYVMMFGPIEHPMETDVWRQKINSKINVGSLWKSKNFKGWCMFPDLSKEEWFVKMEEEAETLKLADAQRGVTNSISEDFEQTKKTIMFSFYNYIRDKTLRRVPNGIPMLMSSYVGMTEDTFSKAAVQYGIRETEDVKINIEEKTEGEVENG